VSVMSVNASTSRMTDDNGKKRKRAQKSSCKLSIAEEELMLDFIRDNPMLWNIKMDDLCPAYSTYE